MKGVTLFWNEENKKFASVIEAKTWAATHLNIQFWEWIQVEANPTDWECEDENGNIVFIECGANGIPQKTMADLPNTENCNCEGGPNIGQDFSCQNCGCPA
jgi:hypothetical protein